MSSCGNPAAETDALMPRKAKFDKSRDCIKCKTEPGHIVIRHAVYCKACFSTLVTTKFHRCLDLHVNANPDGPRRTILKASGNLLIGFSGGLGSTVLLDIVSQCYFPSTPNVEGSTKGGKGHPRKDRVWKKVNVCYVEVCNAFSWGQVKDRTEDIREVVERYKAFEFIPIRLEDAFDERWWKSVDGTFSPVDVRANLANEELVLSDASAVSSDPLDSLRSYLSTLPTPTAVRSSISTLTRLLLLHTARSTQSSHLLLGTSLTSLSISLINSIAQGAGFTVREESFEEWKYRSSKGTDNNGESESDDRVVRIIRPLRDIGMKECAVWTWWNGLQVVGREQIPGATVRQTINGLTRDFIVGLERDYPSTVSTIARTCAKLAPKDNADGKCALCGRPCQRGAQGWKSSISIRSLTLGPATSTVPEPSPLNLSSTPPASLTPHLCYACHTTLTSRSSRSAQQPGGVDGPLVPLPLWTRSILAEPKEPREEKWEAKSLGREGMRRTVGEFLLEDHSM